MFIFQIWNGLNASEMFVFLSHGIAGLERNYYERNVVQKIKLIVLFGSFYVLHVRQIPDLIFVLSYLLA